MKNETEPAEIDLENPVDSHNIFAFPECSDANAKAPDLIAEISGVELGSWRDSAPVMRLSAYLRANRDAGIRLYRRGDVPCLVYYPPLRLSDIGSMRWSIASHACDLAVAAKQDLGMLIRAGIIAIEDLGSSDDIDAVGSSA